MKTRIVFLLVMCACARKICFGQVSPLVHTAWYPISDDANISYKTSITSYETILFEANPLVHFSFFNNINGFQNSYGKYKAHKQAWYLLYKPELRMYTDNSLPVKMPTYRILAGTQHFWRVHNRDLVGLLLESGHYSNGQDGGTFTTQYPDGSPQSDAVYQTITPQTNLSALLNRRSGNFSTDVTDLLFNYRWNTLNRDAIPVTTHSFTLGAELFHNRIFGLLPIGGYSQNDIRIMGKWRTEVQYQYLHTFPNRFRITLLEHVETIYNAHSWIQPWRFETKGTFYPFPKMTDMGFFVTFIAGHDDYNWRMVDSGGQFGTGISWNLFPPIARIHGAAP